mgnify:CR=1 FL=1
MYRKFSKIALAFAVVAGFATQPAFALTPNEVLATIKTEAAGTPGFQGFYAARGESFFKATHGSDWSCASCHGDNPAVPGKHAKTSKVIQPLAPAANAERFADMAKVEKWFKRNCNDVLGRACTAQEKGDVLTYLLTIRK